MAQHVVPIACKPWTLNGISERLIVQHYEDDYGAAVRSLNAIRDALDSLDFTIAPGYEVRALKREELTAMGSVGLHEVYFGSLGGDGAVLFTGIGAGSKMPETIAAALQRRFGGVDAWRQQFVSLARALDGGPGWVTLNYSHRDGEVFNQIIVDQCQSALDAAPLLALDMYEHAYRLEFGANTPAYIDAFMRNIDWAAVESRLAAARGDRPVREEQTVDSVLSISVEELRTKMEEGKPLQLIDARPRHDFSRSTEMIRGAVWRDPETVDEWVRDLRTDVPLFVYCSYGYRVGCDIAVALRDRGFDARFVRGGFSAWYAAGGARALTVQREHDNGGVRR
ncbi:MAG TPA: Fe-Mn family superoxide dismutase [bacterium]|nr:Fe-Mn family superoxide dismutase [bacterium]